MLDRPRECRRALRYRRRALDTDEAWPEAAETTRDLLESLGDVLDALVQPDPPGPWIVVHYTSGIDIDASVRRASDAKGRVPELIVLLDRDGLLATPYEPPSLRADPERIREWRFLAWWELGNVAKYLDRSALWEALRWGRNMLGFLCLIAVVLYVLSFFI